MKRTTLIFGLSILFITHSLAQQVETLVSGPSTFNDGLALDKEGNIFAARYFSSTVTKITPSGQASVYVTGLTNPNGITFDLEGNLVIPEATANKVTRVDTAGVKTTILQISNPTGILYLPSGDMLISSYQNDKISIMDTAGNVTDYYDGPELSGGAVGLAYDSIRKEIYVGGFDDGKIHKFDSAGNISEIGDIPGNNGFICESGDYVYATGLSVNRIYRIKKDGSGQSVYAGAGAAGQLDGHIDTARFNGPNGIVASPGGDTIFISDYNARSLRMIVGVNSVTGIPKWNEVKALKVFPNPVESEFSLEGISTEGIKAIRLIDLQGKSFELELSDESTRIQLNRSKLPSGQYILEVQTKNEFYYSDIILN